MTQSADPITANRAVEIVTLKQRKDFLRIAAARRKWVSGSMIVQVAPSVPPPARGEESPQAALRVGYTASKRVGNAVARNRAKRRLRDVVRQVLPAMGRPGHDYVLIARTATLTASFEQLIRDFSWCLKRLNHAEKSQNHVKRALNAETMPPGGVKE